MKQIVLFTAVVLSIVLAFLVAWQLINIVLLFLLSLAIAATVRVPIEALVQRGISHSLATFIVYGLVFGLGLLLLSVISLAVMDEFEVLLTDITTIYGQLQVNWQSGQRWGPMVASRLPSPEQVAQWLADGYIAQFMSTAILFTQAVASVGSQIVLAVVLSIYWTADRLRFERLWLSLLPSEQRIQARSIWRAFEDSVGAYMRSELIQSLLVGLLLTPGYWLLGLHYPFLLALVAALAWLIPLIGGLFALIPLVTIVWLSTGWTVSLAAVLYSILVFMLMEFVVERRLYRFSRHQQVLVLLVMVALVDVYGIMGLLIAPFLATAIQLFLGKLMAAPLRRSAPEVIPDSFQVDLESLQIRLDRIQEMIQQNESSSTTKRLRSLTNRLSALLEETETAQSGVRAR